MAGGFKAVRLPWVIVGCQLLAAGTMHTASAACGDAEKKTTIYRALQECKSTAAPLEAVQIGQLAAEAGVEKVYCRTGTSTGILGQDLDSALCGDPSAFVCRASAGSGNILDSQCHLMAMDVADNNNTPEVSSVRCEVAAAQSALIDAHRSECPAKLSADDCRAQLSITYRKEINSAERKLVYTPERVIKVAKLFNRVKKQYLALIDSSTRIPEERKRMLKKMIALDRLRIPPEGKPPASLPGASELREATFSVDTSCDNSDPYGSSNAIYNDSYTKSDDTTMNLCVGVFENLDNLNPYHVMTIIGHELSHSIDPCSLEQAYWYRAAGGKSEDKPHNGAPGIADRFFPGLVSCLRGGAGPDGCDTPPGASASDPRPFSRCTTWEGRRDECTEYANLSGGPEGSAAWQDAYNGCDIESANTPSCTWGGEDPMRDPKNTASYRQHGAQLSQIGESFADFMGSEVVGRIIREDSQPSAAGVRFPGPIDLAGRRDLLISAASVFSRLHGVCVDHNTLDQHPPGYLRTDRFMMGSQSFREAIGCGNTIPPADRGGTTCHGF